jgi:WD40 repeat protein
VNAVAVTPDGRRAISASEDRTLKVWDLSSGEAERTLAGHSGLVNAVAVTPDGRRAISASEDGTLKVWDLSSGEAERTLAGHTGGGME